MFIAARWECDAMESTTAAHVTARPVAGTTRNRLRRLLRDYAISGQRLPSTLMLARHLGVTSWAIQWQIGRMHDDGILTVTGAGRRRIVVFPDGRATK